MLLHMRKALNFYGISKLLRFNNIKNNILITQTIAFIWFGKVRIRPRSTPDTTNPYKHNGFGKNNIDVYVIETQSVDIL